MRLAFNRLAGVLPAAVLLGLAAASPAAAQPTGVATLMVPTGTIASTTPTFEWSAVAGATDYRVYIQRNGAQVWNNLHTAASAGCLGGGTCSLPSPLALQNGLHTWQIRAANVGGEGPWSVGKNFTVDTIASPPTNGALLVAPPMGNIEGSRTPFYSWNVVPGATDYLLLVNGPSAIVANPSVNQVFSAAAVCSGTTCTARPAGSLSIGQHQWWIRPSNGTGPGPWTTSWFVVDLPTTAAQLGCPLTDVPSDLTPCVSSDTTPTFIWTSVSTSPDDYRLFVRREQGGTTVIDRIVPAANCTGGTGLFALTCPENSAPFTMPNARYRYAIAPRTGGVEGQWSTEKFFTISSPTQPPSEYAVLATPSGPQIVNAPTTFTWSAVTSAGDYQIWLQGPGVNAPLANLSALTAGCSPGPICTYVHAAPLATGNYNFWVRSSNAAGTGPWSAAKAFSTP